MRLTRPVLILAPVIRISARCSRRLFYPGVDGPYTRHLEREIDEGALAMRKMTIAHWVICLTVMTFSSNVWAVDPGMYYCVIDRLAGVVTKPGAKFDEAWAKKRQTGTFQPEKRHFVLQISDHNEQSFTEEECRNIDITDYAYSGIGIIPILRCSGYVKYNARISEHYYFSLDGNYFIALGYPQGYNVLYIGEGLGFIHTYLNIHNNLVQEGQCEKFEQ